jgi:hypothetical protein
MAVTVSVGTLALSLLFCPGMFWILFLRKKNVQFQIARGSDIEWKCGRQDCDALSEWYI